MYRTIVPVLRHAGSLWRVQRGRRKFALHPNASASTCRILDDIFVVVVVVAAVVVVVAIIVVVVVV